MIIQSTRFGELTISEEAVLEFSHGLPGFPDEKLFGFLKYEPDSPFAFLQSTINPDLGFLVIEPFSFFKDYRVNVDDEIASELGLSDENLPQVLNIVRVPEQSEEMTANLLAPIIVNWRDRKAMQFILEEKLYTVRHRLFPGGLPKQVVKGGS